MRSISLSWSDGLSEPEVVTVVRTVREVVLLARRQWPARRNIIPVPDISPFGYWVLQGVEPDRPYSSMQWYIDQSLDPKTQELHGQRYLQLVLHEPWQEQTPHYDLVTLHYPLLDELDRHRVFGLSARGRASLLSVYPLQVLGLGPLHHLVLRRLVAHYFGQAVGIPIPEWRGPAGCSSPCAMRPADSLSDWTERVEEESRADVLYCDDCQRELSARLVSSHLGAN